MTHSTETIKNLLPPTPLHATPTNGRQILNAKHHSEHRHDSDLLLHTTGSQSKTGPFFLSPFFFF